MADVTISQLPAGTPSGNSRLPYSQGNTTSNVQLSSLYNNTILTSPIQPAFAAQSNGTSSYNHPANSHLRIQAFSIELFDVGGNYNASQSRFTAPIGGTYSFSGMLRLNPSPNGWLYPMFYVNGVEYGNGTIPGLTQLTSPNFGFGTANFHTLIKLNSGDYVDYYFGVGSAGTYLVDGQSVWYGYLLG